MSAEPTHDLDELQELIEQLNKYRRKTERVLAETNRAIETFESLLAGGEPRCLSCPGGQRGCNYEIRCRSSRTGRRRNERQAQLSQVGYDVYRLVMRAVYVGNNNKMDEAAPR